MTHYHEYHYLDSIKTTLGVKAHGQFNRAIKKPMTRFAREIAKHLITGDIYYPVSERQNRPGRIRAGWQSSISRPDVADPAWQIPGLHVRVRLC